MRVTAVALAVLFGGGLELAAAPGSASSADARILPSPVAVAERATAPDTAASDGSAEPVLLPEGTLVRVVATPSSAAPPATLQGRFLGVQEDAYVISVKGQGTVRLRAGDLRSLEVREPGSPGVAVAAAFAGLAGGAVVAALICASADLRCGTGAIWMGTLAGGVLGAAAGAEGSWRPVPVVARRRVAVLVGGVPRGAGVGLRVRF